MKTYTLTTALIFMLSSICCFGQIIENPEYRQNGTQRFPLILMEIFDSDALNAPAEKIEITDLIAWKSDPSPIPIPKYGLDSVTVNISSPKASVDLKSVPGRNIAMTNQSFKSRTLTFTVSRKGYKTLTQTIKVKSLNTALFVYLTKEDK